jgi:hypothetical protein
MERGKGYLTMRELNLPSDLAFTVFDTSLHVLLLYDFVQVREHSPLFLCETKYELFGLFG